MIQAVTFDLDGVYFPNGKTNFIKALAKLGVSEDEAKRVFLKSDEMNQRYKLGTMTDTQFWDWARAQWNVSIASDALMELLIDSYDVDKNVISVVKAVRKNGYKTLVCSNNFPARVNGLQNRFGFLNDFDASVFSYEVGAAKPSGIIFSELVRRAQVPAESIVFADDNADNLNGAKQIGIQTFLYEGFEPFIKQLKTLGVKI